MSNLVTTRVTVRNFQASEQEWTTLGDEILAAAVQLAGQMTLSTATAQIELIESSFGAKASLVGALLAGYGIVADYKGFKESLVEIAQDSRHFATAVTETIPQIVGHKHSIAQQDVRKGRTVVTAEEISKLIERLERLKDSSQTMSEDELSVELENIARGFRSLRKQLDDKDLATVERHMAQGHLPVPGRPPIPDASHGRKEILRPDTFEELRRRIEEAMRFGGPLAQRAPGPARESAAPRQRRRRYFKSAPVRPI